MRKAGCLALAALAACLDPTQVTLEITTDAPCPVDSAIGSLVATGVVAGPLAKTAAPSATPDAVSDSCDAGEVGTIVLHPDGDATSASALVVGLLAVDGGTRTVEDCVRFANDTSDQAPAPECIVARRQVEFIAHKPLTLPVRLYAACAGVRCAPGKTCVPGAPLDETSQPCVSAAVECDEASGECEEPTPQGGGGMGAGGEGAGGEGLGGAGLGGMGGAGGMGGEGGEGGQGGGPVAVLTLLPPAPMFSDCAARGVSEDGSVIVGLSPVLGSPSRPQVWRDGAMQELNAGNGEATEACGDGSQVIGFLAGAPGQAIRWSYAGGAYGGGVAFRPVGSAADVLDCDDTGQYAWINGSGNTFLVNMATTSSESRSGAATGFAAGGTRGAVMTTQGTNTTVYDLVLGAFTDSSVLKDIEVSAITADGTHGVGMSVTGPMQIDLSSLAPSSLEGVNGDKPRAVAFNGSEHVAVGVCGGKACVWEGTARYQLEAWPAALGADFSQLGAYFEAVDISADGKVIVGNGVDGGGTVHAWVLRLP
ncbi:MAG: hypothetical protein JNL21_25125 [Myxococcales bacterium]|nr:hypothetical protein [Myxococcales bacterium]